MLLINEILVPWFLRKQDQCQMGESKFPRLDAFKSTGLPLFGNISGGNKPG